jgi:hypothetical protein
VLSHGGACSCPICSGEGLETLRLPELASVIGQSTAGPSSATPVGVPQLSSLPGAGATLYLDFDGHVESSWGGYTSVVSAAYDQDGNASSFTSGEIASMREIWTRVAEDFAPFNINVTTVAPPSFADRVAVRVVIGGDWDDWFGHAAGGVAYVGGFYNGASNVAYVFEDALANGNPRYTAEAAAHEAGHTFGLLHQAVWSGTSLVEEYNPGTSAWAPIMGVGYYGARTTWHNGPTSDGPSNLQDNMAVLANASNGFGYRSDDFGSTLAAASALPVSGGSVNVSGIIGTNTDTDLFRFTTGGGTVNFSLSVAEFGANLDSVLSILNSSGQAVATASPSNSFGASLSTTLASGTYFVSVRSSGGYGNVGGYTLSGSVTATATAPEISLAVGSTILPDGGTLSFGSTAVGTPVTRTVTVTNTGGGTLNLTALSSSLPAGFTLVSNITDSALSAGESTTFTIRLNAQTTGTFSGSIALANSDGDESPFDLQLSGTVNVATVTGSSYVRVIDNGAAGFSTTGSWIRKTGSGRDSDVHYATQGTGSKVATWNFSGLQPGSYRVSATWPKSSLYATNAPFTVYDAGRSMATLRINQEAGPSGLSADGSSWRDLGTFTITGNQLVVKLNNNANDRVAADAIRIERVAPTGTLRPVFAALSPTAFVPASGPSSSLLSPFGGEQNPVNAPSNPASSSQPQSEPSYVAAIPKRPEPTGAFSSVSLPQLILLSRFESLLDDLAADVASSSPSSPLDDVLGSD